MSNDIPKSTLKRFAKMHCPLNLTAEALQELQQLSGQFVYRVGSEANEICDNDGRQQITPYYVYQVLFGLCGMETHKTELQEIVAAVDTENKRKREHKKEQQRKMELYLKECRAQPEDQADHSSNSQKTSGRPIFPELEIAHPNQNDLDFDYDAIEEELEEHKNENPIGTKPSIQE